MSYPERQVCERCGITDEEFHEGRSIAVPLITGPDGQTRTIRFQVIIG